MLLSELCIRRPVFATMLNVTLAVFGLVSLSHLPVRELPDIDPPIVTVTTIYRGANASVIESEVTDKLEEVINGIEGIKDLVSESREQLSTISVEFYLSRPIDVAAQDVRDRVARVRSRLPDDIEDPIVAKQDSDARPMMWVALFGEKFSTEELTAMGERLLKEPLQAVAGVSSVIFGGEKRKAIRLRLDPALMAAHNVTVSDVERALREQNVELPSGRIENVSRELSIETRAQLSSPEEFDRLVLQRYGTSLVRLSDVGTAEAGVEDERSIARYRSKPSVGLGIVKQSKANTVAVAQGIKAELERRITSLPAGVETFVAYDESIFVEKAISEVWSSLYFSLFLVVLIIFLFLRNVRSTLVPSLTIPIAAIATFSILEALGYSVNILTLLGLVLAIGVIVDDSIVVLENIYRHIEEGMPPFEAALQGIKEITFAVIATTLALVIVFLPLSFQKSITGRLFIEFAVALAGSVVVSAFVALTLTPMLCAKLLKPKSAETHGRMFLFFEDFLAKLTARYVESLRWALNHRKKVAIYCTAGMVATFILYQRLESEFLPEEDKGRLFSVAVAPEGSSVEYTDRMVRKMESIVAAVPEVAGYFSAVALPREGPGRGSEGLMFVRFREDRQRGVKDIVAGPNGIGAKFFRDVEGALAIPIMPKAIGGGFGQTFQLVIQHQDLTELNRTAQNLVKTLQGTGYLRNLRATFEINKPQLLVDIDRERAQSMGVSIEDLSRTVQILFGGMDLSSIKLAGEEYEVVTQLYKDARLTPAQLGALYMRGNEGRLIPLSALVSWRESSAPNAIQRRNRSRSATIEGTPLGLPLGTIVKNVESILTENLPPDFRYEWAGEAEDLASAGNDTLIVLFLSMCLIYMVLAAQFESLLHPFTVMLAIPLALTGAFAGLWILGNINSLGEMLYGWANYSPSPPFIAGILSALVPRIPSMTINLFSQIGMLLLFGLVTKNSILLVDFANRAVAEDKAPSEAMLEAAKIRLRPILMTAFSTVVGILPIAIGTGVGAEGRRPMGIVVISGMMVSTLLTLFVVPVVYTVLGELRELRLKKIKHSWRVTA